VELHQPQAHLPLLLVLQVRFLLVFQELLEHFQEMFQVLMGHFQEM
jgi:hypothetical protein